MNTYYQKSAQQTYNTAVQAVPATLTTLNLLGTLLTDTGCSLSTNTSAFRVNKTGLYRFSFDIIYTGTAAGNATIQAYNNGVAIPSAIATETVAAADTTTLHIESVLCLPVCCVSHPNISVAISGNAGTVNTVLANIERLA